MAPYTIPRVAQRLRRRAMLAVCTLVATVVVVALPAETAMACSLEATYEFSVDALAGADPTDPLAQIQPDFDAWIEEKTELGWFDPNQVFELPRLLGISEVRRVATIQSSEAWMGSGGVLVVDSAWGAVPNPDQPTLWRLDTSSCADIFTMPVDGELIAHFDTWGQVTFVPPTDRADLAEARETLTKLFGEPLRPERNPAAESDVLEEVFDLAERDQADNVALVSIDPDLAAERGAPTSGSGSSSTGTSSTGTSSTGTSSTGTSSTGTSSTGASAAAEPPTDPSDETATSPSDADGSSESFGFPLVIIPLILVALGAGLAMALRSGRKAPRR